MRITIAIIALCTIVAGIWFFFFPKWTQSISDRELWELGFLSDTLDTTFSTALWQTDGERKLKSEDWQSSQLVLRNKFQIRDTSKVLEAILRYHNKYNARVFLNGQQIASTDRFLIDQESAQTFPDKVVYQPGWDRRQVFISQKKLSRVLRNGENVIDVMLNDEHGTGSVKLYDIGLQIKVKGPETENITFPLQQFREYVFTQSELPIFRIDAGGLVIPDDPKIPAVLSIIDGEDVNKLSDTGQKYEARLERRGQTSQGMAKRSYTLALTEKKVLLGLPASDRWVLYGPYMDRTMVRNALAYTLYAQMGRSAPKFRYIELILNNNYCGMYLLVEKVQIGPSMLDIHELQREEGSDEFTGGYLLEIDRNGVQSPYSFSKGVLADHHYYSVHSPKWAAQDEQALGPIKAQYQELERRLIAKDRHLEAIDMGSFIDYMIITEFCKNVDGYRLSTFLYNPDISRPIPKFYIGPIWDFNFTFGLTEFRNGHNPNGLVYQYDTTTPFWWSTLMRDPEFHAQLVERYKTLREGCLSDKNVAATIDSLVNMFEGSLDGNFKKWDVIGMQDFWPNEYTGETYKEEIEHLKEWSNWRANFLDYKFKNFESTTDSLEGDGIQQVKSQRQHPKE